MTRRKSGKKPPKPALTAALTASVVPSHGHGRLLPGGVPGNAGGVGRPPSVVKRLATAKLPKHIETLDTIADGLVTVALKSKCPKCGHEGDTTKVPMEVRPGERVRAVEVLAKIADARELVVASDNAAAFFDCVHKALVEVCGEVTAEDVRRRAVVLMGSKP